ncbi:transposase [Salipiger manganoxidans]|uniref:Transposase n=1 Tax=Salipiger marinus TaxID=555512 RepID=A0A1G8UNE1_9RHOB|nr:MULTISPECIES: transposase [Salipiger]MCD1621004.1 transposase [Salipiger manganoxidans]SDJ55164.1 transposase [Salipiger marinus]
MACASVVSPIEIFTSDELGRRRHWSDADKVRIVEESLRGQRQGSATARRYGISRSLLTVWRREYRTGALDGRGAIKGFVPLVVEDATPMGPEAAVVAGTIETIGITLTNGRRMTIPVSLAPAHLAALLAVLDPR